VLDRLKRSPRTRHIPVEVITAHRADGRPASIGAFAWLEKPVSRDALEGAFAHLGRFLDRKARRLLVIEDDEGQRRGIVNLLAGEDLEVEEARDTAEALRALEGGHFDGVVLDLVLPDRDGVELLEQLRGDPRFRSLPIVVYTAKELTAEEHQRLKRSAESVIVKSGARSPDQLMADTELFLHRVARHEGEMAPAAALAGRKAILVDDDVRNIFALTSVLEREKMIVRHAQSGHEALQRLEEDPDADVVLMDIMMPGMDGYETIAAIRRDPRFRSLPIVAITAKALKDDRDRCLAAGASDYLPKPVEAQRLLEVIRRWVPPS
jgi:CheY-like chemotaxis protein